MKKLTLVFAVIAYSFVWVGCENQEISEEVNENTFEIQNTDKQDSINSNGGGNDRPDNDEE